MADAISQNRNFLLGYFEEIDSALWYRYEAERVCIQPWGENSLRIRATRKGEMPKQDWALIPQKPTDPVVEIDDYSAAITREDKSGS